MSVAIAAAGLEGTDTADLSEAQRLLVLHELIEAARERFEAGAVDLLDSLDPEWNTEGKSTALATALATKGIGGRIGAWAKALKSGLRKLLLAGALALGGPDLSDADVAVVEAAYTTQLEYADGFATAIKDGSQSLNGTLPARVGMYADAAWGMGQGFLVGRAKAAGKTQVMNLLESSARHCGECPELTDLGWVPIGSISNPGSRECLGRCRCELAFR